MFELDVKLETMKSFYKKIYMKNNVIEYEKKSLVYIF